MSSYQPYQYGQQHQQQDTLNLITTKLNTYWSNLTTQTSSAFNRLTPQDAIRLVVVVCAYALIIRPLLIKLGAKVQAQAHEADAAEGSNNSNFAQGLDANDLRNGGSGLRPRKVAIPGVESDSESDEEGVKAHVVSGEWGRKARVRQRKVVRRALELREQHGLDEDDEDIKEFLED